MAPTVYVPHLIQVPWAHASLSLKQHPDQLSCLAGLTVVTITQTTGIAMGGHVPTLPRPEWVMRFAQIRSSFGGVGVGVADSA